MRPQSPLRQMYVVHRERPLADLVHVQAARLAEPVRPRLPETGRDRDDGRAHVAFDHLELVPLAHRRLMNVAGEDQVCAGRDERAQDTVSVRDRPLARGAPRGAEHVMVEHRDAKGTVRRRVRRSAASRSCSACRAPPWWRYGRAEFRPTTCTASAENVGSVVCHWRSNSAQGRVNRAGKVYGRSWFPGTASTGAPSERRKPGRVLVLLAPAPVRQVAGRDDERRPDSPYQRGERRLDLGSLACTRVEIGYMEEACRHDRMRL